MGWGSDAFLQAQAGASRRANDDVAARKKMWFDRQAADNNFSDSLRASQLEDAGQARTLALQDRESRDRRFGQGLDVFRGIFAQPETQMQPANAFARRRPMVNDAMGMDGGNEQNALVRYLRQMGVL